MQDQKTPRFVLRRFHPRDWEDMLVLAKDWVAAPGPAFDKWPTDPSSVKSLTAYLAASEAYLAIVSRTGGNVVGLLANNGTQGTCVDLGHVIHSSHQDGDRDLEVIQAAVAQLFQRREITHIKTCNDASHREQLAPLLALGFTPITPEKPGELQLSREQFTQSFPTVNNNSDQTHPPKNRSPK